MLIRCPTCTTQFRMQPEHIDAAAGQVRCGRCAEVFNAEEHIVTIGPAIVPPSQPVQPSSPRELRNGRSWRSAILLLLVALPLQWAWWERELLAADPDVGPLAAQLCRHLACRLRPFYARNRIEVLERTLEPDPSRPNLIQFRFRIVNRAFRPQPFPLLDVKLVNGQAEVIGVRRFTPREYLSPALLDTALMQPDEPIQASLDLLNPKGEGTGFQVDFR